MGNPCHNVTKMGAEVYIKENDMKIVHMVAHRYHYDIILETFSTLLVFCAGNSPATGEFPAQRPVMRKFDISFDLRLNKWVSKQ